MVVTLPFIYNVCSTSSSSSYTSSSPVSYQNTAFGNDLLRLSRIQLPEECRLQILLFSRPPLIYTNNNNTIAKRMRLIISMVAEY